MGYPEIRKPVYGGKGFLLINKNLRLLFPYFTERAFSYAGVGYGKFGKP
jgi:hypothetical protein